ncbi:MAG: 4Fe-4S dicluster domain-containing protein [Kiritimatiellaeota bacterium]|nr:4Fe-4S dicluster domain-containing protein [Kiritimatiellota bacterium]
MKSLLVVRPDRCLGCRSCELACGVAHSKSKTLIDAIREDPLPKVRVWVEKGAAFSTPLQCRHCEQAPCVEICPTMALRRRDSDSPVVLDGERCIGCRWCLLACPFGVIRMDGKNGAVVKCDLCTERLAAGELPACVESCHTGALAFEAVQDVPRNKREAFLLQIERATEAAES